MLYNTETKKEQKISDCINCGYFQEKRCKGIDRKCFIYDQKTKTIFNSKTGLPVRK